MKYSLRHVPILLTLCVLVLNIHAYAETSELPPTRFGATLTLTGSSALFGQACQNGITLAVEDVNAAHGIKGSRLEVLVDDFAETDLKRAVSAAQQLLSIRKVVALLPIWSEDTEVISPIAEAANVVTMALGAGGPKATRYAESVFRATTSDSELALKAVRDERARGAERACVLLSDTNYYIDSGKELVEAWKTSGGTTASEQSLPYSLTDVATVVTKMRNSKCDTIFLWVSPATLSPLIRELRTQRITGRRILPWFADAGDILKGTIGDTNEYMLYRWLLSDLEFKKRYTDRFKLDFLRPAGNCYDGVRVLATVMNQVGTKKADVRAALLNLKNYTGVTGPFIIQADRERTGEPVEKMRVVDGKLVTVTP